MFSKYKTISLFLLITTFVYLGAVSTQTKAQDATAVTQEHQEEGITQQTNDLEIVISNKNKEIDELNLKVEQLVNTTVESGLSFEQWAGIVLASVAVIVTTLGVGIAIFSFFGYRNAMVKASEVASEKASEVAYEAAKNEITKRIENGDFHETITVAIQKIAYEGILSSDEIRYEEENSEDIT